MEWAKLIEPTGIIALVLLFINILGGMFMRKLKLKLIYHKIGGALTLAFALLHFILIQLYY
ncbi:MAG: hypothetical protein R6U31_00065 [bacterium]